MSKAVKSVRRAVSGVVKGVTKAVKGVVKGVSGLVKKISSSKLGRVLIMAAAIYFGGAAIMGGMKGMAAGTGFMSGAGTGIANAWTGLQAAGSAAMGGNFSAAGSNLSAGFQGTAASAGIAAPQAVITGTALGAPGVVAPVAAPAAGGFMSSTGGAAAITAGGQIAGGLIQGAGQQKALEDERAFAEAERERINNEMATGRFQFGEASDSSFAPPAGGGSANYNTPNQTAGGPALVRSRGVIGSRMNDTNYGYEFPVYNPAMSRFYG